MTLRRSAVLAAAIGIAASTASASASAQEPVPRNGAALAVTSLLLPAIVVTGEYAFARDATFWMSAGAGSTRTTHLGSEPDRRAIVTGGVGGRAYFKDILFGHIDLSYFHVGGGRDDVVETTSSFTNRARQLSALYAPGLSVGAGLGAVIAIGATVYIEIRFTARWVVAGRRATPAAPNVFADGAVALVPAIAVGIRL